MRLGMVTYNMGKDMSREQLIALCHETGLEGLELRTTHAHGVEVTLSKEERHAVREQFAEAGVAIACLGSAFEYHAADPAVVRENVDGSCEYAQLAADLGCKGIKVRPNGLREDISVEATCEQIGVALRDVGNCAGDLGVQVHVEVHGRGTSDPRAMRMIMDHANHPAVSVCWNSNATDMDADQSIQWSFDLLKDKITHVHITDIGVYQYPWQDLFDNLKQMGYQGWCMAEIQYNPEPERFMKYYRTLFDLYTGNYQFPAS
jgi:sugar phosphate isomerase/epimerase